MGRLQFWLQGHPNKHRPWAIAWLGNRISDLRYWLWRLRGGKWDELDNEEWAALAEEYLAITPNPWTASNLGAYYEWEEGDG